MTRVRSIFRCADCGATAPRWAGRCSSCGEWNTLAEEADPRLPEPAPLAGATQRPVPLSEVDGDAAAPRGTGVEEFDRVLGGGLVPGSITLVGGEPGIGKSTLLLQTTIAMACSGLRCLIVCAEESSQQVKRRAIRLGPLPAGLWVVAETSLAGVQAAVDEVAPDVLVVDSIQTLYDAEVESGPGSVTQVRACALSVVQLSKSRGLATIIVGHVTKEGTLAGPRLLEHMVDTVLTFEGERHHALRLLRATKNRFGPTGELGLFEMTDAGLRGVPDPGSLFLGDRRHGAAGSAVFPAMEGHRPLLVEIQALVAGSGLAMPRRSASGLDGGRLALLVAVLDERAGVVLTGREVYVSVVGGVRVNEPGADLATALALASAAFDVPLSTDMVACGEVGLAGELRQVSHTPRRLAEAARLGFRRALVPMSASADVPHGTLKVVRASTLAGAIVAAGIRRSPTSGSGRNQPNKPAALAAIPTPISS
ncbi:MAG: DNA repair protein RadA [Actinomycetota bacterium]|nr:DNA repair protein RadA [Actinomycetota bacterium]